MAIRNKIAAPVSNCISEAGATKMITSNGNSNNKNAMCLSNAFLLKCPKLPTGNSQPLLPGFGGCWWWIFTYLNSRMAYQRIIKQEGRYSERLSTANPLSLKQMHPSAQLLSVFWETVYKLSGPGIHKLHKAMNFFRKDN